MQLAGKTALITGAARGIGRAFAASYLREGAQVAIADIDDARAAQTAEDLGEGAFAVHMDVTCLLYTSPSPRDQRGSRMPSSA